MTELEILETLKAFLQEKVCPQIKLQKPVQGNRVDEYKLTNPAVHIGWIPPDVPDGEDIPDVDATKIPCLVVGVDEGEIDGCEMALKVRISIAVFNPGTYCENGVLRPDFQGYRDLQNLIALAIMKLVSTAVIDQKVSVDKPVKFGMYKNQPHPMWYGWITFSVKTPTTPYVPGIDEQYL